MRDDEGQVAMVHFGFDGCGEHSRPTTGTPVPATIAEAWGVRRYEARFVLEGGTFNTDGEGHAAHHRAVPALRRNLELSRGDNEDLLKDGSASRR